MSTALDLLYLRTQRKAYDLWQKAGCPEGGSEEFWFAAQAAIEAEEAHYDEELDESFPASDPPAHG
jgi:hypothetical protein